MANVTIPDLPANNAPSTNTLLEVSDSSAIPVSGKSSPSTLVPLGLDMANLVAFTDTIGALSVESTVADGTDVVALEISTQNSITAGSSNSVLVKVLNGGTEELNIFPHGGIGIGPTLLDDYGFLLDEALVVVRKASAGHVNGPDVFLQTIDGVTNAWATITSGFAGTDSKDSIWAKVALSVNNTQVTRLDPAVNDGASAVAYEFNTVQALANAGAKIARFRVDDTERVAIAATSSASQSPLLLWDVENNTLQRVTYGANDTGGAGFRALVIPNAP